MIPYIGDISKQDADLLAKYARSAKKILEFGSGASTQVLAWAAPEDARVVSVETEPWWIERTKGNLEKLGITRPVEFVAYHDTPGDDYDLVFVDGVDDLRRPFSQIAWLMLKVGGHLMFHDTRRHHDLSQAMMIPTDYPGEVSEIRICEGESNITVLTKREKLAWEDWNVVEGRSPM